MGQKDGPAPGRRLRRAAQRQAQGVRQLRILLRHHEVPTCRTAASAATTGTIACTRWIRRTSTRSSRSAMRRATTARWAAAASPPNGSFPAHALHRELRLPRTVQRPEPDRLAGHDGPGRSEPEADEAARHDHRRRLGAQARSWCSKPVYTRTRLDRTIEDAGTITAGRRGLLHHQPRLRRELDSAELQRLPAELEGRSATTTASNSA